jgi:hypothetical protein
MLELRQIMQSLIKVVYGFNDAGILSLIQLKV